MPINIGDRLPVVSLRIMKDGMPSVITTDEIFSDKNIVLFGVPGAFTPTCSKNHLPGFLKMADEFAKKGVDKIAVISVNDVFVMDAWAKNSSSDDSIVFIADGSAGFTKAAGLELDLTAAGLGVRCKRFSMLVENCVVKKIHVEENSSEAIGSSAEAFICQL